MVEVKYLVASLFSSYIPLLCCMCSVEWDNCHNNWHLKNFKIQDGRQNIEILLNVIKMAHIDLKKILVSSILNLTDAICTYLC